MGRSPCCDDVGGLKKGPWTPEEDKKLVDYIQKNGHGSWRNLPKNAGLNRCGKSCRLRWTNYLRPDIKRGKFAEDEERLIIHLHSVLGNKWSAIAGRLPGRTDNEIKNYWNTHLRKKLLLMGIDPVTHQPRTNLDILTAGIPNLMINPANLSSLNALRLQADAAQLAKLQLLQNLVQVVSSSSTPANMDVMSLLGGSASLRNHQFSELLQFNRQLEGLVNGCSLGLVQDPISTSLGYPNFPHTSNINQAGVDPSLPLQRNEMVAEMNNSCFNEVANNRMLSSVDAPTANSTPSLVSTSSEMTPIDHAQEPINSNDASVISSASTSTTPLDAHDSFNLDDLDTDFSWKDILDQISWSDEL